MQMQEVVEFKCSNGIIALARESITRPPLWIVNPYAC
jgi:hypothetical protein